MFIRYNLIGAVSNEGSDSGDCFSVGLRVKPIIWAVKGPSPPISSRGRSPPHGVIEWVCSKQIFYFFCRNYFLDDYVLQSHIIRCI